jgi:hypothetical protein
MATGVYQRQPCSRWHAISVKKVEFPWGGKPHFSLQQKESLLMKTKLFVAAVLFLCFTVAAFAQTTYTVGSTPVTTVVESGYTEKTGDITFSPVNPAATLTVTGTITVDYGDTPVTYLGAVVVTGTGATATLAAGDDNTQLVITVVPTGVPDAYNIRLTGVRVQVAGDPGVAPLNVEITTVGNLIVAGQTNPRVLNAVHAGIASLAGTGAVRINSVTGQIDPLGPQNVRLTAVEGFRNAFGVTTPSDATQANVQQILVRLDQAVPAGVTITFPGSDSSTPAKWTIVGPAALTSASGPTPTVYYQVATDTDITLVENFILASVTVTALPVTTTAYVDTVINATVSLAPLHVTGSSARPRYAYVPVGSVPLVTFYHPTTTLLVPFAFNDAPSEVEGEPVYGTGLTIANVTKDPGSALMGFDGAVQQSGTFTLYLYTDAGTVITVPSSALPAKGILAAGVLGAGETYTVLLSEVLAAAVPAVGQDFSGYVFIICQFTNGHGEYFVSDWNHFSHGALMLVLQGERDSTVPEALNN